MKNPNQPLALLGGLSISQFLEEYWQKKPLFVKGAVTNFKDPLSADEIAGLACEEFIPSRLILEEGGIKSWELRKGPFDESAFCDLPENKWMLVVNDLEKFLPELKSLTQEFDFIPSWRMDDLQVSLGSDQGNVGAHWDDYDVFLLQGEGRKHWKISFAEVSEDDFVEGVDIRLIDNFRSDEEWIVEQGDLLYLPPRIGHYGINIGRSITWSIGFRAPKHIEMAQDFTAMLLERFPKDIRFTDPDLQAQEFPSELTEGSIDRVMNVLRDALSLNRKEVINWFGEYITAPKMHQEPIPPEEDYNLENLIESLQEGALLERHPGLTFIFQQDESGITLYCGGERFCYDASFKDMIIHLCEIESSDYKMLMPFLAHEKQKEMLVTLLNLGYLDLYNENDE